MAKVLYNIESGVPGVRLAMQEDEGELFALLLLLHEEMGFFSLNPNKVLAGIRWATERKGGVIFVIEDGNRIVATLGMTIACDWYSDDEYLLERWNFVHPQHRRNHDYARKLLEQGKWSHEWFRAQGKSLPFMCGINTYDRLESKVRLYARHMPCIGAYFMYGLPPLQTNKAEMEMRLIDERREEAKGQPSPLNIAVRPAVETILRVSQRQREDAHV
jgi:hypothetical protein